jgi:hypothetical protein
MRLSLPAFVFFFLFSCAGNQAPEAGPEAAASAPLPADSTSWSDLDKKLNPLLNDYFSLKDALVAWDTATADAAALELKTLGDSLVKDSAIALDLRQLVGSISAEADGLLGEKDITEKRRAFSMISQHFLPLLKQAAFGAQPVYQQMCPMAFNDNETAYWLSNQREIVNPYLGLKHPKYASGMLHCGELADSLSIRPKP